MSYVCLPENPPVSGPLAETFRKILNAHGFVDHILWVHALNPKTLSGHLSLYRTLMFGPSPLSRGQRELLALVVSRANCCQYCLTHHGAALRATGEAAFPVEALAEDPGKVPLAPENRALVVFAEKLTRRPWEVSQADIDALRQAGFADRAIADICMVVAYFNFVNRLALGLGVELESYWRAEERLPARGEGSR